MIWRQVTLNFRYTAIVSFLAGKRLLYTDIEHCVQRNLRYTSADFDAFDTFTVRMMLGFRQYSWASVSRIGKFVDNDHINTIYY